VASRAVCKRGHIVDDEVVDLRYRLGHDDGELPRFCGDCGAPVVLTCEACKAPIPRRGSPDDEPHPFCTECGSPFPWATREQRTGQLVALLEHEHLDDVVRLAAVEAIEELTAAEPDDEAAQSRLATRLRRLAPGAWDLMKPVLQSVLTEAARKQLDLSP
jgi:hypothetical protein